MRPLFLPFEGLDGSGKSTHLRRASEWLARRGVPHLVTHEPGGTPLGDGIRGLFLDPRWGAVDGVVELLLVFASRRQHLLEVIEPALQAGQHVLCDRFTDSTRAYQGYGRGVPLAVIDQVDRLATGERRPDHTLLFHLPAGGGPTIRSSSPCRRRPPGPAATPPAAGTAARPTGWTPRTSPSTTGCAGGSWRWRSGSRASRSSTPRARSPPRRSGCMAFLRVSLGDASSGKIRHQRGTIELRIGTRRRPPGASLSGGDPRRRERRGAPERRPGARPRPALRGAGRGAPLRRLPSLPAHRLAGRGRGGPLPSRLPGAGARPQGL